MKVFLSSLRLGNDRNPSSVDSSAGRETAQSLSEDEDDDDDFRTAATSNDWDFLDDEDDHDHDGDEISSGGERYAGAAASPSASTSSSSPSSSSMRNRVAESGVNSAPALMNDATSASSAAVAAATVGSAPVTGGGRNTDSPPTDDCCPICFGCFVVPCKAPCGHWYCGGCILQYWNYGAALQPCNCPMCSRKITNLTPEASVMLKQEVEVTEVLKNVRKYNRLFVGGLYGFILRLIESPLYIKRMFQDMMNPDRPVAHLHKLRIIAMLLGLLYTISPLDFLHIGRRNIINVFDFSAIALSLILYVIGIYHRRRRFQRVRQMAANQD